MSQCLDRETLIQYLGAQVEAEHGKEIENHVETCSRCQQILEELTTKPSLAVPTENLEDRTILPETVCYQPLPHIPGFEDLTILGQGGMGVVYRARQIALGRVVALKMIPGGELALPQERERFPKEALALAKLEHPNIVRLFDFGQYQGLPYFSMEFCPGGTLQNKLAGRMLPPHEAASLVETLARAIHEAHCQGVVHRDLKPSNVLLARDGTLKITDFGLARFLGGKGQTGTGARLGTPSYMAPEQAGGRAREIGVATDVYALGAILYECLTGRPPFRGESPEETVQLVLREEPLPPRRLNPPVPKDLERVCLKCLEKEPSWRYQSGLDLADDLRRFQQGESVHVHPIGRAGRLVKWMRRQPAEAALLALGVLALVGVAGMAITLAFNRQLQEALDQKEKAVQEREQAYRDLQQVSGNLRKNQGMVTIWQAIKAREENGLRQARFALTTCPVEERSWPWFHLDRLCHSWGQRSGKHEAEVSSVAISPDEKRLVSVGQDHCLRICDSTTGQLLKVLPGLKDAQVVIFSPDGQWLAIGDARGEIQLRDGQTGQVKKTLTGHNQLIGDLAFHPASQFLASASDDHTVSLWNVNTEQRLYHWKGHETPVLTVAFSPEGHYLRSVGRDQVCRSWEVTTGRTLAVVKPENPSLDQPLCAAFRPNLAEVAFGGPDGSIQICQTATGKAGQVLSLGNPVVHLSYHPNGKILASGNGDGTVCLFEAGQGQPLRKFLVHESAVTRVAFSCSARLLASGSTDRSVAIWEMASDPEGWTLPGPGTGGTGLVFSTDGDLILPGADLGTASIWHPTRGKRNLKLEGLAKLTRKWTFDPKGQWLALAYGKNHIGLWEIPSGRQLHVFDHQQEILCLAQSPDGKLLASAGFGRTVKIWSVADRRMLFSGTEHLGAVFDVAFSPDSLRVATASEDGTVMVWNSQTGEKVCSLKEQGGVAVGVAFSPNGRWLASAGADLNVRIWDCKTWKLEQVMRGHTAIVYRLVFSPDSATLASASEDGLVKLWSLDTFQCVLTLSSPLKPIMDLAFSPDGRLLAAGSKYGTVKVWGSTVPEVTKR